MTEFPDYYDRDGKVVDLWAWAALFEDRDYQVVAQEDVLTMHGDMCWVSTVWLGINHNYFGDGPPLIFETAIFWPDEDVAIWARYPTEKAAREGHALLVAALSTGLETRRTTDEGI